MAIQTRITQRFDVLSNWIQNDIVLLQGELAVVDCGSQIRFKIGDGIKSFTQLPFVDQSQLCTHWIAADAISQGLHAKSVPYGFAAGAYLCANANFSQALGFDAQTISSDIYSFVWNGDDTRAIEDYYTSHGRGTFSVNPLSGLSGVFIGEQNLADVLDENSGNTITIDDQISGICKETDLSIVKISAEDYADLVASDALLSDVLYVVEGSYEDVYGQQVKNMAPGTDLSDAVNLEQLAEVSSRAYDTYTQTEVDQKIASAQYFKKYVVQTLPPVADADERGIYLVPSTDSELSNVYDEYVTVGEGAQKTWEKIGSKSIDLSGYKTKQTAKTSPTASGTTTAFIDTISQDENGVITATKKNIQSATTQQAGIVQLNNTLTSTATNQAATANVVKQLNDTKVKTSVKVAGQALTADVTAATISSAIGLSNYALNSNALHKTGDETASGHKIFSDASTVGQRKQTSSSGVTIPVGANSFAVGQENGAAGTGTMINGYGCLATGYFAHAEGNNTVASGQLAHTEGTDTVASGLVSHAEGNYTTASGTGAHAEGMFAKSSGVASHAEGSTLDKLADLLQAAGASSDIVALFRSAATQASGPFSHTEGLVSETKQMGSHAQGFRASDNENQFSFVWQGYNGTVPTDAQMQALLDDPTSQDAQIALGCLVTALQAREKYSAKAPGTFCINPSPVGTGSTDPATGFYIGDKNLPTIIGEHVGKGKKVFYGTCSTSAGTAIKDVVCEDFTASDFVAGTVLVVKFSGTNTNATPYIRVAGTSKRFYIYGTTNPSTYMWHAGQIVEFVYDGNSWLLNKPQYATTSYEGAVKLVNSTNSTYTDGYAATPNSVKMAYDGSVHTTQVKDPYASGVVAGDVASAASVKTYLDKRIPYVEDNQSNFTAETLGNRRTTSKADVGEYSLAVGSSVKASGKNSVATGNWTVASGESSHAEGNESVASGLGSHAEGNCGNAVGNFSHAEGSDCEANGLASHAEGSQTVISQDGIAAHAEGVMTMVAAPGSHIEGLGLDVPDGQGGTTHLGVAGGFFTHVEGMVGTAQGMASHIEGFNAHDGSTSNAGSFVWQGYQGTVPSNQQLSEYFANPDSQEAQAFFASALQSTPAYAANGQGTFNINPKPQGQGETDPASGFFIGQQSLKTRLKPLSGQTMPTSPTQNQLTEAVKKIWQALGGEFS